MKKFKLEMILSDFDSTNFLDNNGCPVAKACKRVFGFGYVNEGIYDVFIGESKPQAVRYSHERFDHEDYQDVLENVEPESTKDTVVYTLNIFNSDDKDKQLEKLLSKVAPKQSKMTVMFNKLQQLWNYKVA